MSATSVAVSIGPSSLTAIDAMWSLASLCTRLDGSGSMRCSGVGSGPLRGRAYEWGWGPAKPYFGISRGYQPAHRPAIRSFAATDLEGVRGLASVRDDRDLEGGHQRQDPFGER